MVMRFLAMLLYSFFAFSISGGWAARPSDLYWLGTILFVQFGRYFQTIKIINR
jgi:hypothetical protein